jgi:hypothetical protein
MGRPQELTRSTGGPLGASYRPVEICFPISRIRTSARKADRSERIALADHEEEVMT